MESYSKPSQLLYKSTPLMFYFSLYVGLGLMRESSCKTRDSGSSTSFQVQTMHARVFRVHPIVFEQSIDFMWILGSTVKQKNQRLRVTWELRIVLIRVVLCPGLVKPRKRRHRQMIQNQIRRTWANRVGIPTELQDCDFKWTWFQSRNRSRPERSNI